MACCGDGIGRIRAGVTAVEAVDEVGAGPAAGLDRIERGHGGPAGPVDALRHHFELAQREDVILEPFPQAGWP